MLNIAYIGNGKSTNRYHLPFVNKLKNIINVKYIYVRHFNFSWDTYDDIEYTSDLNKLLIDPDINLIVITTPIDSHYKYIKLCLENNKNVLCEKPFLKTSNEAKELFTLAKSKNLLLECYQNRRYDSDFLTVQKIIESGKLDDIFEIDMHFDYFRPEIPYNESSFNFETSFLYTHACHTLDQVISYFGVPEKIVYDVRSLLGKDRMNDYFDLDLFYCNEKFKNLKVSVKSSYFRLIERPSFVVYGKNGVFIKNKKDRQEEDLKKFYMPYNSDFGIDLPEHYGTLTYLDNNNKKITEKIKSEIGDYSIVYKNIYDTLILKKESPVKPIQTIKQLEILEQGIKELNINQIC